MTAPTNGQAHGHGHEEQAPPFMPDAHFAVQVQQEEITTLRTSESFLKDRVIYLRSVILQIQAEAQHQASLHLGEIENLRAEIVRLRAESPARGGIEVDPDPVGIRADEQPQPRSGAENESLKEGVA